MLSAGSSDSRRGCSLVYLTGDPVVWELFSLSCGIFPGLFLFRLGERLSEMTKKLADGVVVEFVGEDILILDTRSHAVHTFPMAYRQTVEALVSGRSAHNLNQVNELVGRGLVTISPRNGLSRRAVLVGAGAVGAALAMPTAAVASSSGLVIGNDVFKWNGGGGDFIVEALDPQPASLFAENSIWTLTIDSDSRSGTVTEESGSLKLAIGWFVPEPPSSAVLQGILTGPGGITSNLFQIPNRFA